MIITIHEDDYRDWSGRLGRKVYFEPSLQKLVERFGDIKLIVFIRQGEEIEALPYDCAAKLGKLSMEEILKVARLFARGEVGIERIYYFHASPAASRLLGFKDYRDTEWKIVRLPEREPDYCVKNGVLIIYL